MKIAIFHNALDNIGGAEIVGLTLARELNADIYTTNIDHDKIRKMGFDDLRIYSIGKIPFNAPFRQQVALYQFRNFKLKQGYDFCIIDGDWAVSGAVNTKPNLWYVHSPIREIWDLYQYTRQNTVPWYARWVFDAWVIYNRYLNKKYVKHVGCLACNSKNTMNRVKKYLGCDAEVIHPPVDTAQYRFEQSGDYWLSVNRLITHKRIDVQIEAFRKLNGQKLIIVGSYEQSRHFQKYAAHIKNIKPDNVEILSWVDAEKLRDLYANCKGFITTSKDEDFGMTAIEAMASGKPVIAPNEGGYKESVLHGQTGFLLNHVEPEELIQAIEIVGRDPQKYKDSCIHRAKSFDTALFIEQIKNVIKRETVG